VTKSIKRDIVDVFASTKAAVRSKNAVACT